METGSAVVGLETTSAAMTRRDALRVGGVLALGAAGVVLAPNVAVARSVPDPDRRKRRIPKLPVNARSSAADVLLVQGRLSALGYWCGRVDGGYGLLTAQAVTAVQKAAGLRRTGVVDGATWRALSAGVRPRARIRTGHLIEVDKSRQLLLVVDAGVVRRIINTSTGRRGMTTPSGTWRFHRYVEGWRNAEMYRPRYYHRGYAVHGHPWVPPYPASHGCSRVTPAAMDMLCGPGMLRIGDRITIY